MIKTCCRYYDTGMYMREVYLTRLGIGDLGVPSGIEQLRCASNV